MQLWTGTGKAARLFVCHDSIINQQCIACSWRLVLQWWRIFLVDYVRIHNLLYCIILVSKGTFVTWDIGHWTSWDIPRYPEIWGTFVTSRCGLVTRLTSDMASAIGGTSQNIPGCERTFVTWDFGHCLRWDKVGTSWDIHDVKGLRYPGAIHYILHIKDSYKSLWQY